MSTLLDQPRRHAITTEEYLRMGEAGVFAPEARLELIEGEIIEMAPIGSPHMGTVNHLARLCFGWTGNDAVVAVQQALIVGKRSVLQPDVAILRPRKDAYFGKYPDQDDVLLVIEVAESTLRVDLRVKAPLYARAAIAEFWVFDVNDRSLHVHRDPAAGHYASHVVVSGDQLVEPALLPGVRTTVAELFPPLH